MKKILIAGACLLVPGCASVIDGTSQQIALESNPPGAQCLLNRNGVVIGNITTPGAVLVKKTKHDIEVSCTKDGYQTSTSRLKSEIQGATWGNIILGGGIGWAIDSASGADNKYQDHVTVTLSPDLDALKAQIAAEQASATSGESTPAVSAEAATEELPLDPILAVSGTPAPEQTAITVAEPVEVAAAAPASSEAVTIVAEDTTTTSEPAAELDAIAPAVAPVEQTTVEAMAE